MRLQEELHNRVMSFLVSGLMQCPLCRNFINSLTYTLCQPSQLYYLRMCLSLKT